MANTTLQSFNVFLTQRLTAAAVEIFGFVEKTIIDYNEEVYRTKQENQRLQRLLDLVYKPEIRLYRADSKPPSLPASTEVISPKQQPSEQEWNPSLGQEDPGPSQIKVEERVELWTSQNEEPPSAEDSDDGDALTRELIKTVQELENHTTTENSTPTEENSEPQPSSAEDPDGSEAKKSNDTFYRCHICNFIFTKEVVLTWHLKTHTDKGTFDCQICGKHIPCQSTLQTHMRVHTGERPYSCHFCGKSFKLKGHMKEHIRTHTGEKPFICHICGKSFNRGSTMRKHVFVKHKEERPYKCADCDELFTERLLMKRHMRKVHGVKLST